MDAPEYSDHFPQLPGETWATRGERVRKIRLARAKRLGTHTETEWLALVTVLNGECVACGVPCHKPCKDHILPLYRGGSNSIDNLQPLCIKCNTSKGGDSTDHRRGGWADDLREEVVKIKQARSSKASSRQKEWWAKYRQADSLVNKDERIK